MEPPREAPPPEELRRFVRDLHRATPRLYVTPSLVGLCALVYVAQAATSAGLVAGIRGDLLLELGANYGPLSLGPEPYRLLTSAFLHGGLAHIAFNMAALYQLGRVAERLYGNLSFLAIFLLSGLAGSLASASWGPPHLSVGASGAVFGVVGAVLVGLRRASAQTAGDHFAGMRRQLLVLVGVNLAFGMLPMIDNAAHLGGLAMGLLAGRAAARRVPPPPGTAARQAGALLGLGALLAGTYTALVR